MYSNIDIFDMFFMLHINDRSFIKAIYSSFGFVYFYVFLCLLSLLILITLIDLISWTKFICMLLILDMEVRV